MEISVIIINKHQVADFFETQFMVYISVSSRTTSTITIQITMAMRQEMEIRRLKRKRRLVVKQLADSKVSKM